MNTSKPSSTAIAAPTGTAVPEQHTAVAGSTAIAAQTGTAVSTGSDHNSKSKVSDVPEYEEYVIEGISYRFDSIISKQSGEAKIIHVSSEGKDFALKLYKPGHHPDHTVLQTLNKVKGNKLLVDIYAHGIWTDAKNGQQYDYELMQYCKGRSLAVLKLNGDEQRLKEIAIRMAAAIDYCHHNNILHRDIKPANFLFTGTEEKEFVLTDFGIGRHFDSNGNVVVDFCRTPIYAAPEMYDCNIPGEVTTVTKSSDWYAMGMTLLALWMGEGVLTANERKLLQDKREETIPYPTLHEMSEHTLSLIKALTRMNPAKRATYEDIERWAKGEVIYRDPFAVNDNIKNFRIIFSAKDNLIAHSPKELGEIMWANKALAKRYLYSEHVAKWLREAERPEDAMEIDDITEKMYPGDQDAGLYAACLVLNPELAYTGKKGNSVKTKQELAEEIFSNITIYGKELTKPTHELWVYLRRIGFSQRVKSAQELMKKNPLSAMRFIGYTLDPSRPYIMEDNGNSLSISDLQDFFKLIAGNRINDSNISILYTTEFLVWMEKYNSAMLRECLKKDGREISPSTRLWKIIYAFAPNYGYDLKPKDATDMFTCDGVMHELTKEIMGIPNRSFNLSGQIVGRNFDDTRLAMYLESKKVYSNQISWIKYCTEFDSDDNRMKYAPYNNRIALMKIVTGIINENIPLTINGVTVRNIPELEKEPKLKSNRLNEMQIDLMVDWLALQFQENPNADYNRNSYMDLTRDYCDYLNRHVPDSTNAKRSNAISATIKAAKSKFNNAWKKVNTVKWGVLLLCLVPMLLACCAGIYTLATTDSGIFKDIMGGIGNFVGGIAGIIVGLYLLFTVHWIAGVIAFGIIYYGLVWLLMKISVAVPWVLIAIIAVIAFIYIRKFFTIGKKSLKDKYSNMDLNEAETFAKIGAAFNSTDKLLPSLPSNYPACVYDDGANEAKKQISGLRRDVIFTIILTVLSVLFVNWVTNKATELEHEKTEIRTESNVSSLAGSYYGTFDGQNISITLKETDIKRDNVRLIGEMRVLYDTPTVYDITGIVNVNDMESFSLSRIKIDGSPDDKNTYLCTPIKNEDGEIVGLNGVYVKKGKKTKQEFSVEKE